MVVFEEASQIRPLKLLKVLTKVVRANGTDQGRQIILSGDPEQLPPFVETNMNRSNLDIRSILDFTRMYGSNHALILTKQQRMHPDIAELVRALFYEQQMWEMREPHTGGVFWIDTSNLPRHARKRDPGTSWYNRDEIGVIVSLVDDLLLRNVSNILVVSPYLAQVDMLIDRSNPPFLVRTVDGCQGRTADAVIVSFVTLDRQFVFDRRRMNVAMSRARNYLSPLRKG